MGLYTLMHKNVNVADIEIDNNAKIIKLNALYEKEHLPLGTVSILKHEEEYISGLNKWWIDRSIPASRSGLEEALKTLGIENEKLLLLQSYGLSLSDHYWIKPIAARMDWKDVNYFDNTFSEDVGDALLGIMTKKDIDLKSPDNTSDGKLKKRWAIINGERCLFKNGENPFHQQPFNELIGAAIANRLSIPHTPYSLIWINDYPYSVCKDFVTKDTELVSAYRAMRTRPEYNHENDYLRYVNACKEHGIGDIEHSLDMMIVLDYIIVNEDRHLNNLGIIRNPDTLEWKCAAPIYDNGSSLGYNKMPSRFTSDIVCKPFKKTHGEQLKLVTSFDWVEFDKLKGIEDEIVDIMSGNKAIAILGEGRCYNIARYVRQRIEMAERAAIKQNNAIALTKPPINKE